MMSVTFLLHLHIFAQACSLHLIAYVFEEPVTTVAYMYSSRWKFVQYLPRRGSEDR